MRQLFLVLACLAIACCGAPQPTDEGTQVDGLFKSYANTPGAAIAVVKDGRVVFTKGFGLANVQQRTPITANTVFDLASVSKQFTATCVLLLAKDGRLSLDDKLSKFFPEFVGESGAVTVRQLLNHTSGIGDYMEAFIEAKRIRPFGSASSSSKRDGSDPTAANVPAILAGRKLMFRPGTKYEYSNSGYVLLGQIAERASGKRLAELMSERIFKPLKMDATQLSDERTKEIKDRAHSYQHPSASVDIDYTPLNLIYGDGNVNTTVSDMAKWCLAFESGRALPEPWRTQAWSPPRLSDGTESAYGFGWTIGEWNGSPAYGHGGAWVGFRTMILLAPKDRLAVVLLSNLATMDAQELTIKVMEIYTEGAQ